MKERMHVEEYRATALCIDSYQDAILKGRFYNRFVPEGRQFQSLSQFLLEMDHLLEEVDEPKSFTAMRTFLSPGEVAASAAESEYYRGEAATFLIRILFRQNSSWQGTVTWVEGKQEQSFRSVLELIVLLDNALSFSK